MQAHDTPPLLDGRRSVAREPRTCLQCGDQFIPKRQTRGMFCSRACYWKWWPEHRAEEVARQGRKTLERLKDEGRDPRAAPQAAWKRRASFRHTAVSTFDDESGDDELWAERGRYWSEQTDPGDEEPAFYRRQDRKPLVLAGHGLRLRVHRGSLVVTHGFTHYPQKAREQRFFPGDPKLPSRIILLSTDGSISLDVARWLSEQHVPLVLLDYRGQVVSVLGHRDDGRRPRTAAGTDRGTRRRPGSGPRVFSDRAEARGLARHPGDTTGLGGPGVGHRPSRLAPASSARRSAANHRRAAAAGGLGRDLLFRSLAHDPLRWKGTGKKPIPPEWRRVGMRQDVLRRSNRNARHPVNAMLNYGYAVLESQVRIAIAEAGLDPSIGYLHVCQPGRQAFVYDLMEPYRPEVDREMLEFVRVEVFMPRDFVIDAKGVCRLHPDLASTWCERLARKANADGLIADVEALLGTGVNDEEWQLQ